MRLLPGEFSARRQHTGCGRDSSGALLPQTPGVAWSSSSTRGGGASFGEEVAPLLPAGDSRAGAQGVTLGSPDEVAWQFWQSLTPIYETADDRAALAEVVPGERVGQSRRDSGIGVGRELRAPS